MAETRAEKVRRSRRTTAQHAADMRARYESGDSLQDLSIRFGVSEGTAARAIRAAGGEIRTRNSGIRRGKQVVREHGAEMLARYEQGEYLSDLAAAYGISASTVALAIRRQGGEVRKRGFGSTPERFRGAGNPAWKGGAFVDSHGYRKVWIPEGHPFYSMARRGYVPEHRLVMAEMVKRPLLPTETVHHIDGDKLNNDPTNLQLRLGQHGNGSHWRCGDCGSQNVRPTRI